MKGYWHMTALAASMSIVSIIIDNRLIIIISLIWLVLLKVFKRLNLLPLIVSLIALVLFSFYIPTQIISPGKLSIQNEQLTGQVVQVSEQTPKKIEFVIRENVSRQKYLIVYFKNKPNHANVEILQSIKYGAKCSLNGKINVPQGARNPGQFDYQNYLVNQGITAQVIVDSFEQINCSGSSIFHPLFQLRQNLLDNVKETFSNETAGWLQALVLGDRSQLDREIISLFQRWGLSHLLAISGLHVGIIVASIYFVCVRFGVMTKESAEWLLMGFLPMYALIAGSEPSVLRASLMVMIFLVINKIKLDLQIQDTISIVFILLIIFNPYIVYHIGFQFSFLVTFALILSRQWLSQTRSTLWQLLIISFVSQMIILPFQIHYFHAFQPLSVILNLFIVPYFSLIVIPLMFFSLIIMHILPFTLDLFMRAFEPIHKFVMSSLFFIDKYMYYPYVIGDFPVILAVIYYVVLGLLFIKVQQQYLKQAFNYSLLLVLIVASLAIQPYFLPQGTITMLDIGQGDAFVIELPYRKGVIFVDAGATVDYEDFTVTDHVYMNTIKPYLYSRGIQSVDAIILSHEHVDHNGSSQFIIEEMNVPLVIVSKYYEAKREEEQVWETYDVEIQRLKSEDSFIIKGQVFNVLSPMVDELDKDENSLVLQSVFGNKSWLFTGDIFKRIERKIISKYKHLSVDVLKVAHHGSKTSSDESFVNQIQPKYGLISVGENNSYGHPNEEVINTLEEAGTHILRTDQHGAVQFIYTKDGGTFFTYLP